MKFIISFFLILMVFLISIVLFNYKFKKDKKSYEKMVLPAETENENVKNNKKVGNYQYDFVKIDKSNKVNLYLNSEKLTSEEAIIKYNCTILTSASFYLENGDPIGLFIQDGEILSSYRKNAIMNSIFSINYFDTPRITSNIPKDKLIDAIQTGPMLIENSYVLNPKLESDKNSRRVGVSVNGDNEIIFFTFYNNQNVFLGPTIEEIPNILSIMNERESFDIADATNLDGGNASVFYVKDKVYLKELTNVGSFYCVGN